MRSLHSSRCMVDSGGSAVVAHFRVLILSLNLSCWSLAWVVLHVPPQRHYSTALFASSSSSSSSLDANKGDDKKKNTKKSTKTSPPLPFEYSVPRYYDITALLIDMRMKHSSVVIETMKQLELKEQIFKELDQRGYDPEVMQDHGNPIDEFAEIPYDTNDPDMVDEATLGYWDIFDLQTKYPYEWNPLSDDPDPNQVEVDKEPTVTETEKDEDGVEVGFSPILGFSNPIDTRTRVRHQSIFWNNKTKREEFPFPPPFPPNDLEIEFNEEVAEFRRSLNIMETYIDPFLPSDLPMPEHVAKWHGYPELKHYKPQNFSHNRFTPLDKMTDFNALTPYEARKLAVTMARRQNAEWMTRDVSVAKHRQERAPYEAYQTLVGTLRRGECDPAVVQRMQPALKILGSCVDLLSIQKIPKDEPTTIRDQNQKEEADDDDDDDNGNKYEDEDYEDEDEEYGLVLRFAYHGLMKNKYGMKCWTETLLRDECGLNNVNNVIFESGFRRRDPVYDGGDAYDEPAT